jgi:phage shock protein C
MYCTRCGVVINEKDKYCAECGASTGRAPYAPAAGTPRLSRPVYDRKIAGVCSGFARHFGLDVTLIRIVAVVLAFWPIPLTGLIAYLVAWIVMPEDPKALPVPGAAQPAS